MTERPSHVRYVVLLGLCLIAGLAYIHRGCFGGAESTIRADLHLTKEQTGRAMGIFFWTYALFQIPTGLFITRFGARGSMLLFGMMGALTLALGAGTLVVGTAGGLAILFTSRALMGVAQAGLFPAATRCIATWFPVSRRAFATGTLQACMSGGAAIGFFLIGPLLGLVYWPWVFIVFAVPGVLWSIWFYSWYRDHPADHKSCNEVERKMLDGPMPERSGEPRPPTPWLKLAIDPQLIWLCSAQFFRACGNAFWLTWCVTYLQEVFSISKEGANPLTGIPFMGVLIGSFFGGVLADLVLARTGSKRWSRNGVSIGTAAVGVGLFVLAWGLKLGVYETVGLLFLAAVFSSGANSCAYSVSIDVGGRYLVIVFGAMNMFGNFGAGLLPQLVPGWTDALGWATLPLLMALLYSLGIFCWCFVNPNGTILEKGNDIVGSRRLKSL